MSFLFGPSEKQKEEQFELMKLETEGTAGILHRLTNRCFTKCAKHYNDANLSSSEMLCLDRCAYKYMLAVNMVGQRMQQIGLNQQQSMMRQG